MGDELISVEDARRMVLERAAPLGDEPVPVSAALGRSLAEDVVAPDPIPPFDNSAMDGFAVVAADAEGAAPGEPVRLPLLDESRAGTPAGSALERGRAIAISTGAAVPAGADAVVPIEDVEASQGEILLTQPVQPGRHIRRAGEVVAAGQQVLRAGVLCGPSELGVLTGVGRAQVRCARRPRLAVLTTGDELRGPDEPMEPGTIRDANAASLPALATASGAEVVSVSRVGDDRAATEAALAAGLEADVLVVSGGVSVGEHDHVRPALTALGVDQVFWRVALRPGKPTLFAVAKSGTLVFGLPGNPVSSMVTFLLFARPAIDAQLGLDPARSRGCAALAESLPLLAARTQAVRCSLELSERGWTVTTTGPQGSHVLTSMLGADCLAFVPPGEGELEAGAEVEFELLPGATVGGGGRGTLT